MFPSPNEIDAIFANANRSGEILRGLYELFRSHHRKVSISFLCRRMGVTSKGHLCFMMKGKRSIPNRCWTPLVETFRLTDEQAEKLLAILEADSHRFRTRTANRSIA